MRRRLPVGGLLSTPWGAPYVHPDHTLDRLIAMAVERGKLGDLLINTLAGAGPRTVAHLLQALERTPHGVVCH
jgi:hypothetical protein